MVTISPHVSYAEVTHSSTAKRLSIDNTPNGGQIERIKTTAKKIFEPLREYVGVPIYISSCFRSKTLNEIIGGSRTSQHMTGEAMDLDADVYGRTTNRIIFDFIKDNLEFDQLIYESGNDEEPDWVHVSYTYKYPNRKQVLKATRVNGKTNYEFYNVYSSIIKNK